jgi:hypothetical protein
MDIKKANMNLLLGKIRTYLDAQPEAKKKGKRFIEAEKALVRLEKSFAGKVGKTKKLACKKGYPAIPPANLLACKKGYPAIPPANLLACKKGYPAIPPANLLACKKGYPAIPPVK